MPASRNGTMDLSVKIGKTIFKNPVWVASGTFGYGREFEDFMDLNEVGAIITKTVTLDAREGNPPPRLVETPSGLLNSIGLENKGVGHFKREYYPFLRELKTRIIVSIAGHGPGEFERCAERFWGKDAPDAIELNLSCPNVTHGGTRRALVAQDALATERIVRGVRKKLKCALIAKLTPNVTDIAEMAEAAENGGADAVSLVNTYFGMAVDPFSMKPLLGNVTGGLSGPAIKPMALKAVWDVYNRVKVPVIGMGGIMNGLDVAEFMISGASAVQIGTANLVDPDSYKKILGEFKAYLKERRKNAAAITGKLKAAGE